jgi:hypothetical protein
MEFVAVGYDPSWGTTWAQYKYGVDDTSTGVGGYGSVGPGTIGYIPIFDAVYKVGDSPLHIVGTTLTGDLDLSVGDIIIHNAIKDSSENILIGYGSPMQLNDPASNRDVSIYGDVYFDGSLVRVKAGILNVDGSIILNGEEIGHIGEASINYLYNWNISQDASIIRIDASLNNILDGSANVFVLFSGDKKVQNSFFKESSNKFTVANDIGDLIITSGLINGDLIIKTIDNGFSDFYLDPRNGIVNIGRDQTNSTVSLQASGTLSNINFHIQPSGLGKTRLGGELELSSISNVSTNKILYYDSSTFLVTYGNSPIEISGTPNYIPKFNLTGNELVDTSIYQIDNSIYIGGIGETAIYNPRLKPSSGATTYFYFLGGVTPYFNSGPNLLELTSSGAPGFMFSWDVGNTIEKISFDTTFGGSANVPLFLIEGGTQFTTPNGNKGGDLMLRGGSGADASYGGGDIILAGGKTGSTITGNIKLAGIDSSIENYVLYYRPDTSIVTYGSISSGVTSLSALTDVSIVDVANNNLLQYDTVSSKWKNISPLDGSAYFQSKITKTTIPGTSTTGIAGEWVYDSSYLYLCTSTNKWGRTLLDYNF